MVQLVRRSATTKFSMTATPSNPTSSFGSGSSRASCEGDAFVVVLSHASVAVVLGRSRGAIRAGTREEGHPRSHRRLQATLELRWPRCHRTAPGARRQGQARPVTHHQAFAENPLRPRPLARRARCGLGESEVERLHAGRLGRRRQDVARGPLGQHSGWRPRAGRASNATSTGPSTARGPANRGRPRPTCSSRRR